MFKTHLELVENMLRFYRSPGAEAWSTNWLRTDICYELFIHRAEPVVARFEGRAAVEDYLALLKVSYQILDFGERTLVLRGNVVTVRGIEQARLTLSNELVQAEWVATYEIEAGQIKRVSMTVYGWTILVAHSQDVARPDLFPTRQSGTGAVAAMS